MLAEIVLKVRNEIYLLTGDPFFWDMLLLPYWVISLKTFEDEVITFLQRVGN
jgi:hypothetical protein